MEILKRTTELIKLANSKGFEMDYAISPVMFESWMNAEMAFCNVACSILSMWLRDKGLHIAIAPFRGEYSFFVDGPGNTTGEKPNCFGGIKTWEEAWLTGIEKALNLM